MPARSPSRSAHSGASPPAIWLAGRIHARPSSPARRPAADRPPPENPPAAARPAPRSTSTCAPWRRCCAAPPPGRGSPHSVAATMSQCSSAVANRPRLSGLCRSQCSSFANPHSEEYTPPHHSMASSPARPRRLRDQRRFPPRAVVAPEVIIVERLQIRVHRHHARPRGVDGQRLHRCARHPGRRQRLARGLRQRPHVVRVALRGVVRIVLAPPSSGYSAVPEPSRPRSLSTIDTRTLNVPKSTPATIAIGSLGNPKPTIHRRDAEARRTI